MKNFNSILSTTFKLIKVFNCFVAESPIQQCADQLQENTRSGFGHDGQLAVKRALDLQPENASNSLDEPHTKRDCPSEAEKNEPAKIIHSEKSAGKKPLCEQVECYKCKTMVTKGNFARHFKRAHPNLVRCSYKCTLYFDSDAERQQHEVHTHHPIETLINKAKEKMCHSETRKKKADWQNVAEDIVRKEVECGICKLMIRSDKLQYHLKFHQLIFRCAIKQCVSFFATEAEKRQHEVRMHADQVPPSPITKRNRCISCLKWFENLSSLNEHVESHRSRAIKCDFSSCDSVIFKTKTEKDEHFLRVHAAGKLEIKCVYCGKMYLGRALLQQHIRRQHAAIKIMCKFFHCGLHFLSQVECDEHFREEHAEKERLKMWQCPKCRL